VTGTPQPTCSRCGTVDPAAFARSSVSASGYQSWCRRCTKHKPTDRRELVEWLVQKIHAQRDAVWGFDPTLGTALGMCAFWMQAQMGEWLSVEEDAVTLDLSHA